MTGDLDALEETIVDISMRATEDLDAFVSSTLENLTREVIFCENLLSYLSFKPSRSESTLTRVAEDPDTLEASTPESLRRYYVNIF
ncbi:hypothetical protein V6N12_050134 [Hibiscus sabdariffa]|uniref:Uncharacterized protein n=1 Tax=Hibiscus sabdariffa TaxID=183260 RepID=A0ABR2GBI6_9ROSI